MALGDTSEQRFLPRARLQLLLDALRGRGYRCVGPQMRDGAIVYDELESVAQLPVGVQVTTAPGEFRVETGRGERLFAWANGPQGIKPWLFAPRESLWRAERNDSGRVEFVCDMPEFKPTAFIGARACDLAALSLQDQVFMDVAMDPWYVERRRSLFVVAVNCSHPASTCFCASTGDGPGARDGFDLALDELDDGFVARASSEDGRAVLDEMGLAVADAAQLAGAQQQLQDAAAAQSRSLPGTNLRDRLLAQLEHPRWDEVATRCLACGNCTMVCPSCFCHAEREEPTLGGHGSEHLREWDSCFSGGHSYIHGLTMRPDTRSRYRQWLVHKLGTWHDQFGRSGCTGCGRCISWCPVGIDITEEAHALCNA